MSVRDARYLRAQAQFCLEMADQISDQATCEKLHEEAARYHAEAIEIESGAKTLEAKPPPEQS